MVFLIVGGISVIKSVFTRWAFSINDMEHNNKSFFFIKTNPNFDLKRKKALNEMNFSICNAVRNLSI